MNSTLNTAPALFSAEGLTGVVFLVMVGITIIGGLIACNSERLVRAISGLIVCFVGVAGIYFFLNSPFVAMMQILIYVGAVAVTISFAIMLAAPEEKKKIGHGSPLAGPLGFISAALMTGGFSVLAFHTVWQPATQVRDGSIKQIGIQLLTEYSMVFEVVSIVLLIAILGALVIAREGREG